MTREEAKTFLCSIAGDLGFTDIENYTCKDGEKMREAIKTLEQEPCTVTEFADHCRECGAKYGKLLKQEPCDDAISRQAVENAIAETIVNGESLGYAVASDILSDLPPVTPVEKVGRWIYGEDNTGGTGRDGWYCNQCGRFEFWDYSMDMKSAKLNLSNFCPNCGARMEVEE